MHKKMTSPKTCMIYVDYYDMRRIGEYRSQHDDSPECLAGKTIELLPLPFLSFPSSACFPLTDSSSVLPPAKKSPARNPNIADAAIFFGFFVVVFFFDRRKTHTQSYACGTKNNNNNNNNNKLIELTGYFLLFKKIRKLEN